MSAPKALVIGGNRGIGFQFVKTLIKHGYQVTGTIRPATRKEDSTYDDLIATGAKVIEADFLDETSLKAAAETYAKTASSLDVLVNCGGLAVAPISWEEHTAEIINLKFQTMALGPFLAIKHFKPLLAKSQLGKIINISSTLASFADVIELDGEVLAYRMAKVSLNMVSATIGREIKKSGINIATAAVHPGWIPTRLTGGQGNVDISESSEGMYNVLQNLTMENTGKYWHWQGHEMDP